MAEPETPLTPPKSDGDSFEGSDVSDETQEPRLTPDELGALFVDFYSFLASLHLSHLKIPSPTGWPQITPEHCGHFKSDYAIEVIRHLPSLDSTFIEYAHYKSKLPDLTAFTLKDFEKHKKYHQDWEFWSSERRQMDFSDVVCIVVGHESFSLELWLNVKDCEIFEDFHAGDILDEVPVEEFFDDPKERYQSLKLIPGKRRITIEAENVPERDGRITEEEVTDQTDEWELIWISSM
jgi:hypothetical protein